MTRHLFVADLPDLIPPSDTPPPGLVRVRIHATGEGLQILGDSPDSRLLEEILATLHPKVIEAVLCG